MEEIDIQAYGIHLTNAMRKHIKQCLHSVFGFDKRRVRKIVIKQYEEKILKDDSSTSCHIQIYLENQDKISTKLGSLDIFSAITLGIERAHLKLSHNLSDECNNRQRILLNKKSGYYSSYRIYQ